jgi:uncharacterized protein (DUF952 family)
MNLYHIANRSAWEADQGSGIYEGDTLLSDGFIHCSKLEQVLKVANSFYRGEDDLILLKIDPDQAGAEIRFENTEGGAELFPHLYGPLPVEAVLQVIAFPSDEYGRFHLPAILDE